MAKSTTPTLAALLGARVRAIREDKRMTQAALLTELRQSGLHWHQSAIPALEAGTRDEPRIGELVKLCNALGVTVAELLKGSDAVSIGRERTPANLWAVRRLLGVGADDAPSTLEEAIAARITSDARSTLRVTTRPSDVDAGRSAEQKVARALGVPVEDVVRAARRRWRRSLTEERDRRVAERTEDDTPPRRVQAIRGHVTRELVAELAITKGSK